MKSKRLTYLLFLITSLIWGVIIFKVIRKLNKINRDPIEINENISKKEIITEESDTFELFLNYRDPFLTNENLKKIVKKDEIRINTLKKFKQIKEPENLVSWPTISFKGIISESSGNTVCLLNISNYLVLLKKNEYYSGILIEKIWEDSISVVFESERKTIYK